MQIGERHGVFFFFFGEEAIMVRFFFVAIFLFVSRTGFSQLRQGDGYGFRAGVNITVGTHIQRVGFLGSVFYIPNQQHQLNFIFRTHYNFRNLGPPLKYPELQAQVTYLYGYSAKANLERSYISEFDAMHERKNSVGLFYKIYWDRAQTSQPVGGIVLNYGRFYIIHENDMWGWPRSDKYRSAGVWLGFHRPSVVYFTKLMLWHGDTFGKGAHNVTDTEYPARFGYRDFGMTKFANISHGILTVGALADVGMGQYVQAEIGVDAEQVRNVFQNKVVHDMWFVPERLISYKLTNFPMLDTDGKLFLYKEGQQIRKPRFFLEGGINSAVFY